ncbi:MAG: phage portal protein [Alphaproteobacteria bacterium]|nr:phage portal protein [Alphaproteobacteria bacterium]
MSRRDFQKALSSVRPNLIDRVVSAFDPVAGAKRYQARCQIAVVSAMTGGYTGARRDRRQTKGMFGRDLSADAALIPDLETARARSHELFRNAPLARGAVKTVRTSALGEGLALKAAVDSSYVRATEQAVNEFEDQAERLWSQHARARHIDIRAEQTIDSLAATVLLSVLLDGDALVVRRFDDASPQKVLGLALQLVDTARLLNPVGIRDGQTFDNGNTVTGGIERDSNGKAVAYHIAKRHPGDFQPGVRATVRYQAFSPSGERLIWHIYESERSEQGRGVPYLTPVIEPLKQLDKYTEAEVMAAVVSSLFTVFVKSPSGQGLAPADPVADAPDSTGEFKLGAGAMINLGQGEDVTFANPNRPNTAFDPFVMAVLRQIGVALELPFEILIKHFTASYSASRAAMIEAWRFFKMVRGFMAREFYQAAYEAMIGEAVARGLLAAPGFFSDPLARAAWCGATWTGPSMGQLNPLQETSALVAQVDNNLQTRSAATAALGNGDFERNARRLGREQTMLADASVAVNPKDKAASQQPVLPDPDDDDLTN